MNKLNLITKKIIEREKLPELLAILNFKGQRIVFTNGCFDILHRGHVEYLAKAAAQGDVLFVGLNTDKSVKRLKGDSRPLQDEQSRALILASLRVVSYVILFDEDTPYELIKAIQPDVLIKGSDYKPGEIVGADIVKAKGGKVATVDLVEGHSTTGLIDKMNK
jgi:D-glycero-beta-D-manno-heptose 1-phosphate adenylyltransferase